MPLFLQIENVVFVSQTFTELYSYVLHAILNKDEFDKETEKRSKIFEQKIVKTQFESNGFRYIPNYVVKNKMEIDGIAISDLEVFVIEVKGWGSRKLLEEKTSKEHLDRDIKNSVDGIYISHSTGKIKQKVPLPTKVSMVNSHRKKFRILEQAKIIGLLVINERPTISHYNGCQVMFVDDFPFIKTGKRIS